MSERSGIFGLILASVFVAGLVIFLRVLPGGSPFLGQGAGPGDGGGSCPMRYICDAGRCTTTHGQPYGPGGSCIYGGPQNATLYDNEGACLTACTPCNNDGACQGQEDCPTCPNDCNQECNNKCDDDSDGLFDCNDPGCRPCTAQGCTCNPDEDEAECVHQFYSALEPSSTFLA